MERLSARVSEDALRGWSRLVTSSGCNFTALVEAIGLALHEHTWEPSDEMVQVARRVEQERFSRRRKD